MKLKATQIMILILMTFCVMLFSPACNREQSPTMPKQFTGGQPTREPDLASMPIGSIFETTLPIGKVEVLSYNLSRERSALELNVTFMDQSARQILRRINIAADFPSENSQLTSVSNLSGELLWQIDSKFRPEITTGYTSGRKQVKIVFSWNIAKKGLQ